MAQKKGKLLLARVYEDNPQTQRFCKERREDWRKNLKKSVRIFKKNIRADGEVLPVVVFIVREPAPKPKPAS